MLSKLKRSDNKGFTIIEVMIVLAIAGLILLIVFLAVPALQRNARNTNRKSDAGRISSAVANFITNNQGTLPTTTPNVTSIYTDAGTLGQLQGLTPGTGAMARNQIRVVSGAIAVAPTIAITGAAPGNAVEIDTDAQCVAGGGGTTANGSSVKQTALLYTIEPASGANYTILCLDI
jgi:prepilin-type N-terminal cleavage/methylation domain-containing protein